MDSETEPDDEVEALFADADKRQFEIDIQNTLALYRVTKDGRHIWQVVALHAETKTPLPPWLMAKLAEWAGAVQTLSKPAELCTALELGGTAKSKVGPNLSAALERQWRLAREVARTREALPRLTLKAAIELVARNHSLPAARVKDAFHDMRAKLKKRSPKPKGMGIADLIKGWR